MSEVPLQTAYPYSGGAGVAPRNTAGENEGGCIRVGDPGHESYCMCMFPTCCFHSTHLP